MIRGPVQPDTPSAVPERRVASQLVIRPATAADAADIGLIYDQGIAAGIATFARGAHDSEERRAWLAARPARAPVWCGTLDERVVSWSALAPFSHRPWYDGVAEYTAYVAEDLGGRGIGGRLLDDLIARAPQYGYWKLVGMILAGNDAGLAVARRAGFRMVGTHVAHARRGDGWCDVTVVERHLEVPAGRRAPDG
jgi:L-amino acid N-acyltransferase YncA